MKCVVYLRISTGWEKQNPESQFVEVERFCKENNLEIAKKFIDTISGAVPPMERPKFKEMIEYCQKHDIPIIVMYDLTRFYRGKTALDVMSELRRIMEKYKVIILFAREPQIDDPMLRELFLILKSWYSAYERMMISQRVKYGMLRLKKEGKLYHKPTLEWYYASWLYGKDFNELTKEELENAKKQLYNIIMKYWKNPRYKRTRIHEILRERELAGMCERFPKALRTYHVVWRFIKRVQKESGK